MSKFVIYQVLPRLFGNQTEKCVHNGTIEQNGCGKFNDFTPKALKAIKQLGATHVWYTGVIEHATQTVYKGIQADAPAIVKGKAGSPYAIKDYYDVDPDLAVDVKHRMQEFEALVERTHKAGLKVVTDFVPNHVARQYKSDSKPRGVKDLGETDHSEWAFSPLNNFYYCPGERFQPDFDLQGYEEYPAKATGNDQFSAHPHRNDWYETVKLNYGVYYMGGGEKQFDPIPDTWNKMLHIVLFWASKGVDALRCDMAEMVPVEFWGWMIPQVKAKYPDLIFIAEVYNPNEYRNYIYNGHFDYLYDKVGLYDKLRAVTSMNHAAEDISRCWQAVEDIQDHMLNFLENHDEQRIASGFYCGNGLSAEPAMIVAATLTKAPVMIYMGQELGERGMDMEGFSGIDGRTTIFDYWSVPSLRAWSNGGKYDGKLLNEEQRELQDFYKTLLNICTKEKAISLGKMYDLEYAQNGNAFNRHEHFAFIRKYKQETLLIVINFNDRKADMEINIPKEAFEYLDLKEDQLMTATDLLSGATQEFVLSSYQQVKVTLEAWKGAILKLKPKK